MPRRQHQSKESDTSPADAADRREIRVHGIGLHGPWDVLGSPAISAGSPDLDVGSYTFVGLRTTARAFVWSRTTRRSNLFWYVLLPFTLVNVAGYMVGRRSPFRGRIYRIAIVFFGSLLTAICLLWLVAIVDTIAGRIVQPTIWGIIRWFGFALVVGSLAAFTIARFLRTRHRFPLSAQEDNVCGPDRIGAWTFGANILAIVGAVLAIFIVRPFFLCSGNISEASCASRFQISTPVPAPGLFRELLLNSIIVTFGLLLVAALVLRLWPGRDLSMKRSELSGLFICGVGIAMASVYLASLRNGIAWLALYLDGAARVMFVAPGEKPAANRYLLVDSSHIRWHFVLEQNNVNDFVLNPPDLVGLYFGIGLLALLVVINLSRSRYWHKHRDDLIAAALHDYPGSSQAWRTQVSNTLSRSGVMNNLSARISSVLPVFTLLWLIAIVILNLFLRILPPQRGWYVLESILAVLVHLFSVVAFGLLLLFLHPRVRGRFSLLFDLAGFWPMRFHPLSAPPYGARVIGELQTEAEDALRSGSLRLIGHSQGSVIAFEAANRLQNTNGHDFALVTCGSPLQRLYTEFFPTYFRRGRFRLLASKITWINVYRDTDPIGSKIYGVDNIPILEPGEKQKDRLLGHGGYWTDPAIDGKIKGHP